MFEKILFATTGTPTCDNAAHVAFDLAKKYNSELTLFHVLGLPTRGFSPYARDVRTGEMESVGPDYIDWVKEELKNTYAKQIADCKNLKIEAVVGIPHTEILRYARKNDADLILMGAHTRQEESGATRYRSVVGSSMQKVAKGSRAPVLIVSRPCTTCLWYFSNIIFCADFSKASMSAFKFAFNLAKMIGSKLYLFHSVDLSAMHAGNIIEQADIEMKIAEAKNKINDMYVKKMKDYDNYEVAVWEGVPYVEILKFSRDKNGDLIVMAHHTREVDQENALLGTTVEQVVLRAACPVASVNRPDKVTDEVMEHVANMK